MHFPHSHTNITLTFRDVCKKTSPQAKRHKSSLHVTSLHFFSLCGNGPKGSKTIFKVGTANDMLKMLFLTMKYLYGLIVGLQVKEGLEYYHSLYSPYNRTIQARLFANIRWSSLILILVIITFHFNPSQEWGKTWFGSRVSWLWKTLQVWIIFACTVQYNDDDWWRFRFKL